MFVPSNEILSYKKALPCEEPFCMICQVAEITGYSFAPDIYYTAVRFTSFAAVY